MEAMDTSGQGPLFANDFWTDIPDEVLEELYKQLEYENTSTSQQKSKPF
jgi:hypothetical protein